jgi:hypothetical protein
MLAALALTVGACGSDDDNDQMVDPDAAVVIPGSDQRPTSWTKPDYTKFDVLMSVQVELAAPLSNYVTDRDLMCVMIGSETRAVTAPQFTGGQHYFPLVIAGYGDDKDATLKYYCDSLHRIYTKEHWTDFDTNLPPTGTSQLYHPSFKE